MTDNLLVAIDDGYAQIKVFGDNPDGGAPVRHVFRTSVRSGRRGLTTMEGKSTGSYHVAEGEDFTVSEEVAGENTQFDGFHTSPMNRALVYHGLSSAGYDGRDVGLITGLPVADYFVGEGTNDAKIEAKRANLLAGISRGVGSSDPMPVVRGVDVGCQAVAAWFDHVFDDNLELRADAAQSIAIVDIGGRTTDVAVVVGGRQIDHAQSGTENIGVLDVYKALRDLVRKEFDISDEIPLATLDKAVRNRTIRLWGDERPIDELVTKALADIEGKIRREVQRRIGSAAALGAVVVVGGGGALFQSVSQNFRNGKLTEDPEFANARGLWKVSRLRAARDKAA
jgi:Actin-like ATPase involved in cell division